MFGASTAKSFGQTPSSSSSSSAFGFQSRAEAFWRTGNSSSNSLAPGSFASASTPFGSSTGASPSIFGKPAAFGQPPSSAFGSPTQVGDVKQINGSFAPGSFDRTAAPFGTAVGCSIFAGNAAGSSGEFSLPSSSASIFGTSSSPALGSSTSSIAAASISAFGSSSLSSSGLSAPQTALGQSPTGIAFGSQAVIEQASSSSVDSFAPKAFGTPASFGSFTGGPIFIGKSAVTNGANWSSVSFVSKSGSSAFDKTPGSLFQKPKATSANPVFGLSSLYPFGHSDVLVPDVSKSVSHGCQCVEKLGSSLRPSFGFTGSAFSSHNAPSGSDSAIGTLSTPSLGSLSTSKLGSSNTFNLGTSNGIGSINLRPIFGHPSTAHGSNGTGTNNFPSRFQTTTSTVKSIEFGPTAIKCQCKGSRIVSYAATPELPTEKLVSVSAMPTYESKSHEELRLEDYHLSRSKGTTSGFSSGTSGNITLSSAWFQCPEPSVCKKNASFDPHAVLPNGQPALSSTKSTGPELWRNCLLSTPSLLPTSNPAGFNWTMQPSPVLLKALKLLSEQKQFPLVSQISHQKEVPTHPSHSLEEGCSAENGSERGNIQQTSSQSIVAVELSPVTNPFGVKPPEENSIGFPVSTMVVQHGISCIPVTDSPAPVRRRSLLTVTHLSLGRNRPPVQKFKPQSDGNKVPFYKDELPGMYKLGAPFIPRENPRAWVLRPTEEQSLKKMNKSSELEKSMSICETGIPDGSSKDKARGSSPAKLNSDPHGMLAKSSSQEGELHKIFRSNEADEDSKLYAHNADIQAIVPKLRSPECYTKPPTSELVAKERSEPGFCRHVKDFVFGKHGYGSIKFLGETDVTNIDLESVIQFNYREVIVYADERGKPPVGQGLNKPAEITLLNLKCIDKITGKQCIDGPKVDKFRQTLIKKAAEQGADFVSYDPVLGEWKFRIQHF